MKKDLKDNKLSALVISPQGFIFDPSTGQGFTINKTARFIIDLMIKNQSKEIVINKVKQEFEVSTDEAEIDIDDFFHQLHLVDLI